MAGNIVHIKFAKYHAKKRKRSTYSGWWLSIVGISSIFRFIAIIASNRNRNNSHFSKQWPMMVVFWRNYLYFLLLVMDYGFPVFLLKSPYTEKNKAECGRKRWLPSDETRFFPSSKQFSVSAFCDLFFYLGQLLFPLLLLFTTKLLLSGIYVWNAATPPQFRKW